MVLSIQWLSGKARALWKKYTFIFPSGETIRTNRLWTFSTAPPSEPRNINITVVADSIVLVTWSRPVSDGGREDVKYHVRCSACSNTGSFLESCSGVQFWPSQIDLTTTQVTISKLKSSMLYNITVISKNGVSDQAGISSLKSLHRTFSLNVGMATNPPSTSTIKTVESHLNLTKADGK